MDAEQKPELKPVGEVANPPFWRLAAQAFLDADFKAGDVIPHNWFHVALGITFPDGAAMLEEFERPQLQYMAGMVKLTDYLVREHQIRLWSCRGIGYRWLLPGEQTDVCFEDGVREIGQVLRKMGRDLPNIDYAALTAEERKRNLDALTKLGAFRSMKRRELRLIPKPKPQDDSQTTGTD